MQADRSAPGPLCLWVSYCAAGCPASRASPVTNRFGLGLGRGSRATTISKDVVRFAETIRRGVSAFPAEGYLLLGSSCSE